MKLLDHTNTLRQLCALSKQWGAYFNMYIPNNCNAFEEVPKAIPWFDWEEHGQSFADETGYLLFDSEEEMRRIYEQTVGDDGPTKLNPYNGPVHVYMLTCDPSGQLMNDNIRK